MLLFTHLTYRLHATVSKILAGFLRIFSNINILIPKLTYKYNRPIIAKMLLKTNKDGKLTPFSPNLLQRYNNQNSMSMACGQTQDPWDGAESPRNKLSLLLSVQLSAKNIQFGKRNLPSNSAKATSYCMENNEDRLLSHI